MKNARMLVAVVSVVVALAIPATALAVTSTTVYDSIKKVNDGVTWTTVLSMKAQNDGKYGYVGNGINASKTCYGLVSQSVGSFNYVNAKYHYIADSKSFNISYIGNNRSVVAASTSFTPPSGYLIHVVLSDATGMMQATKSSPCRWAYISMWGCFPSWDR